MWKDAHLQSARWSPWSRACDTKRSCRTRLAISTSAGINFGNDHEAAGPRALAVRNHKRQNTAALQRRAERTYCSCRRTSRRAATSRSQRGKYPQPCHAGVQLPHSAAWERQGAQPWPAKSSKRMKNTCRGLQSGSAIESIKGESLGRE